MEYSIKPNARFFTVLARKNGHYVFVFVWDMLHWLTFDDSIPDIMLLGTGKTYEEAERIAAQLPGRRIIYKYCPPVFKY